MNDMYLQWADEILQFLVERYSSNDDEKLYSKAKRLLAEKLQEDVEDIVVEWYCSDCDYKRRYDQ